MNKYKVLGKKGEGTFSLVLKAQSIKTHQQVAIKCMKSKFDSIDQVNRLREIQALRRLSPHKNIVKLIEVLYDRSEGRLALVFELMEMNVYEMIRGRKTYLSDLKIKSIMYQLLRAMDHMHKNGIFHRDIKPENILVANDDTIKVADFGSCRGIYSKLPFTEYISTRWYRAPECLLTDGYYNYKMDMWGVGCVFFEVVSLCPLFPGSSEVDQIHKIHNIMGTPSVEYLQKLKRHSANMDFNFPQKEGTGVARLIPHISADCLDLMLKMLAYNPEDRISARQALKHAYFKDMRDAERKMRAATKQPSLTTFSSEKVMMPPVSQRGHEEEKEHKLPRLSNAQETAKVKTNRPDYEVDADQVDSSKPTNGSTMSMSLHLGSDDGSDIHITDDNDGSSVSEDLILISSLKKGSNKKAGGGDGTFPSVNNSQTGESIVDVSHNATKKKPVHDPGIHKHLLNNPYASHSTKPRKLQPIHPVDKNKVVPKNPIAKT